MLPQQSPMSESSEPILLQKPAQTTLRPGRENVSLLADVLKQLQMISPIDFLAIQDITKHRKSAPASRSRGGKFAKKAAIRSTIGD